MAHGRNCDDCCLNATARGMVPTVKQPIFWNTVRIITMDPGSMILGRISLPLLDTPVSPLIKLSEAHEKLNATNSQA
jgi:hypothetical protein